MPDLQVALPVGALAFYVYDSLMLLYDNEVMFFKAGRRWQGVLGSDVVLFGKRLTGPAFMAPWALLLRSSWNADQEPSAHTNPAPESIASMGSALLPVRVLCTLMLLLLVVGLPAAALSEEAPIAMLAVFAGYYLLVIASLLLLVLARTRLQLGGKALLMLSVDALACAPFAANLVRKVTMLALPVKHPFAFSRAHCNGQADRRLRTHIAQRVDHLLAAGEENQRAGLQTLAARLKAEAGG